MTNNLAVIRGGLIGLKAEVAYSAHRGLVGSSGLVVDESKNVIVLKTGRRKVSIPKSTVALKLTLPDGQMVALEGRSLVGRPEDGLLKRRSAH